MANTTAAMKSELQAAAIARMAEVMPRMAIIVPSSDAAVVDEDAGAVHPDIGGYLAREMRPGERAERIGKLEPLGDEVARGLGRRLKVPARVAGHLSFSPLETGRDVPADGSIHRRSRLDCK